MYALTHCTLYTGRAVLNDYALVIDGETLVEVIPVGQVPESLPQCNLQGRAVAPGFLDLQLNGCGGVMFNDAITPETLAVMHQTNLRSGTTHFLPTLITTSDGAMAAAIALVQSYQGDHPEILGLHLEGPYLNPKRKGIHEGRWVRSPDWAMVEALAAAGGEVVRLLTVAPEVMAPEMITTLRQGGITLAAGHTDATYDQAMAGFEAGITLATHLFNAMTPWQSRNPGTVGAIFHHPQVRAGIIADGHHVHPTSIALAHRLLGSRLFLVTDATPPVGAAAMESFMIGGQRVYYQGGRCVGVDGTLGGAAITLWEAIAYCVQQVGIPLAEALRMATCYPAEAIHLGDRLGYLAAGYGANLVVFDPQRLEIGAVMAGGQWMVGGPGLGIRD